MTEYDSEYASYLEAKYEARAMGDTDFPDFETWAGRKSARKSAEERWQSRFDTDTQDLY